MKAIEISVNGHARESSQEICAALLDVARWPEFKGYSFLPAVAKADFETKTPEVVGSRIRVQNTDGSAHVEEIIAWDTSNGVALKLRDFTPPLKHLASHFIEAWVFRPAATGTNISRSMAMYPKGPLGWLLLFPISRLMKKALEVNSQQLGG